MTTISRQGRQLTWLSTFGGAILCLIFLTNWPNYHYATLGGPAPLTYYIVPGLVGALVLALRGQVPGHIAHDPLVIWSVIYLLSGLIWVLLRGDFLEEEARLLRLRLLAVYFLAVSLLLLSTANRHRIAIVILACIFVASMNNWLDFMFPFSFVPPDSEFSNPGRGAGLYMNSNQAGMTILAMTISLMPYLSLRVRGLALLIALLGIFPTFSRSAIAFSVLLIVLMFAMDRDYRKHSLLVLVLLPMLSFIGWQLYEHAIQSSEINVENIQARVNFFLEAGTALDDSAIERQRVADVAWTMFADSPLIGNGLASAKAAFFERGTHNMYLMLLAEQGVIGGALYISLVLIVLTRGLRLRWVRGNQRNQDVGTALILLSTYLASFGLFSHNVLDEPFIFIVLALLWTETWGATRKRTAQSGWSAIRAT